MATVKVTVTVPEEHLAAIRALVADSQASTVSGFVQHAISIALDDVAGWQQTLEEALAETGGPLTDDERRWAYKVIGAVDRSPG